MKCSRSKLILLALLSCSQLKPEPAPLSLRAMASGEDCQAFNGQSAKNKFKAVFQDHFSSINDVAKLGDADLSKLIDGAHPEGFEYVSDFKGTLVKHGVESSDALAATAKFLIPGAITESHGFRSLKPTLTRACEYQASAETKKVHALGSMGFAKYVAYEEVNWKGTKKKNPFSGLLSHSGSNVLMALRFSLANPVAHTIEFQGKAFDLEFIPGLGMKFFVDGEKSIDLVAMESLSGQGPDQNYFKYDFSSDFSRKAPISFNTAKGNAKKEILSRYDKNAINHHVMDLVGKRFAQVIPYAHPEIPATAINPHSEKGPHPFVISIADLAATNVHGKAIAKNDQRRPYRLVFRPALDNLDGHRRAQVTNSHSYIPGKVETDFRFKLGYLKKGDRLFYVNAEDADGTQYPIGEIILLSSVLPSEFGDKLYFIQHKLDLARMDGKTIATP